MNLRAILALLIGLIVLGGVAYYANQVSDQIRALEGVLQVRHPNHAVQIFHLHLGPPPVVFACGRRRAPLLTLHSRAGVPTQAPK